MKNEIIEDEKAFSILNFSQNTAGKLLLTFLFCTILLLLFVSNLKALNKSISEQWQKEGTTQQKLISIEKDFQGKIDRRTELINLYGLTLNVLNLKMAGDFDFVKDSHNIIQRFGTKIDSTGFINDMIELKNVADRVDTPLIYITLPDKAKYLELAQNRQFCFDGQMSNQIGKQLQNRIDCIDVDTLLSTEADAPTFDEIYFKTDVHCSTYGEFWIAKMLVTHLWNKYGINFPNMHQVFDLEQYHVANYEFVGNTARSVGEYFVGKDNFEIYKPKYETKLRLLNPSTSEKREGSFEEVMLNGYEKNPTINQYTYWVTNYGRFTSPYYQYINEGSPKNLPNILIISDSIFMRGTTYLALACGKLTVLDPRYFKGTEYVAQLLALEHFDAIIVVATSSNYYNSRFASQILVPNLPEKNMINQETYGGWIANQGICLDTCNGNRVGEKTDIQLDKNAASVKLYGWAADFCSDAPFKELYLQIGNVTTKCQYGIERTSVVDRFKKDSLLKTGFKVEFPAAYLQDAQDAEVAFIGVSADGQYIYRPVTYRLYRS